MNSLHECVTCKDIKDKTYLLPCLHPTCSQCIEDILQDAKQKKRKLPGCSDCGEPFVQDALTTVPSNNTSTSTCSDCDQPATHYCSDCKEHSCKVHGDAHLKSKKYKGHVVQLVVELPFCHKHSNETAVGFCTNCTALICTNCTLKEHIEPPHVSITLEEAARTTSESVKKDVAKLLESVPAIDKEIKKHTHIRTKLEKERADLEAKIADIRKQEKVTTLRIEDLEKTKALVLTTQTQANTLASAATTFSNAALLRLQRVISDRVLNLQVGLGLFANVAIRNGAEETVDIIKFLAGDKKPSSLHPGAIEVTMSSVGGHENFGDVFDHENTEPFENLFSSYEIPWLCYHFKTIAVKPTRYCIFQEGDHFIRNWKIEGSNDGEEWVTLREHIDDATISRTSRNATWSIDVDDGFFIYLRLRLTGPSHKNQTNFDINHMNFWGDYYLLEEQHLERRPND